MLLCVRLRLAGLADHAPGDHAGGHAGGHAGLDEIAARHAVFALLGRGALCLMLPNQPSYVLLHPFYLHVVLPFQSND